MPYKLQGKILDENGQPLYQVAVVKELALPGAPGLGGNVWTNEETGAFTLMVMNDAAQIQVTSIGYKSQVFTAKSFTGNLNLQPEIIIEGKTKKSNGVWWALGIFAAVIGVATVSNKKAPAARKPATPKPAKSVIA